jgi:hypothetical protein
MGEDGRFVVRLGICLVKGFVIDDAADAAARVKKIAHSMNHPFGRTDTASGMAFAAYLSPMPPLGCLPG